MKTLFATLFVLAAACGGTQPKASQHSSDLVVCTYEMAASASAADVQQAIDDVNAGALDPCTGSTSSASSWESAVLDRIDLDEVTGAFRLRFKLRDYKRFNEP